MKATLLRRAAVLPALIIGITLITFLLVRLIPGDPARVFAGGVRASDAEVAQIRAEYGFDDPLPNQYARYIERLAGGDLGYSLTFQEPVRGVLGERFGATAELAGAALILGIPAGLFLGIAGARRRNTWRDHATTLVSLVGISTPLFWVGLMLAWLFSVQVGVFPLGGRLPPFESVEPITGMNVIDSILRGQWSTFADALRHLALPAITLAIIPMSVIARFTRASFNEILGQPYIRTARAYGISESQIIWRHAAKNALLPLVTIVGLLVPALLAGAVLTETVFSWPGIGTLVFEALQRRDYALIQSVTLIVGLVFVVASLIVDVSYGFLDPRIRRA